MISTCQLPYGERHSWMLPAALADCTATLMSTSWQRSPVPLCNHVSALLQTYCTLAINTTSGAAAGGTNAPDSFVWRQLVTSTQAPFAACSLHQDGDSVCPVLQPPATTVEGDMSGRQRHTETTHRSHAATAANKKACRTHCLSPVTCAEHTRHTALPPHTRYDLRSTENYLIKTKRRY